MKSTSWGKSSRWYNKIVGVKGHYYHQHVILPNLLNMMAIQPNDTIVDLGCGQGVFGRSIPPDVDYLGIDISGALINQAKMADQNPHHRYFVYDVSKRLSIEKSMFSKAVMILSLQNIKNWDAVITNLHLLLKDGGKAYFVLNHPYFRIPRQTGWSIDEKSNQQKRWITGYLSPMEIPVQTHPSQSESATTWTYHYPLSYLVKLFHEHNFCVTNMNELTSDKESQGRMRKSENRGRVEIPLFMILETRKQ